MAPLHHIKTVPTFCWLCFLLYLLTSQYLRLPFPTEIEDIFIADLLLNDLPLRVAPLQTGELWRTVSYALLHGSWGHLLLNLFGLWITGTTLEQIIGSKRTFWIFLIGTTAGAAGMMSSLAIDSRLPAATTCIGASAILTACIGTLTTCFAESRITLWITLIPIRIGAFWLLPFMLLIFAIECTIPTLGSAYGAHLGGWIAGLLCGLILRKSPSSYSILS